jgi:hypothetical protein
MKYCYSCGNQIAFDSNFCTSCGVAQHSNVPSETINSELENEHFSIDQTESDSNSTLLDIWKTSIGMSIFGLFSSLVMLSIIEFSTQEGDGILAVIIAILIVIYTNYYLIKIYPSYFTNNPKIQNPGWISFMNLLVGGFIFGPIWNGNLTKREIGKSYNIYLYLFVVSIVFVAFSEL